MNIRRKVVASVAVAVGIASSASVASPAMAAPVDCLGYSGVICMADGAGITGQIWRQTPAQITGCRKLAPASFNNEASFASNRTTGSVLLQIYNSDNCTGTPYELESGASIRFDQYETWWNNKASSIKLYLL